MRLRPPAMANPPRYVGGELMQRGTPQQVREYILRLVDDIDSAHGGSRLYLEVAPGFSWPNVEAMSETIMRLRGM